MGDTRQIIQHNLELLRGSPLLSSSNYQEEGRSSEYTLTSVYQAQKSLSSLQNVHAIARSVSPIKAASLRADEWERLPDQRSHFLLPIESRPVERGEEVLRLSSSSGDLYRTSDNNGAVSQSLFYVSRVSQPTAPPPQEQKSFAFSPAVFSSNSNKAAFSILRGAPLNEHVSQSSDYFAKTSSASTFGNTLVIPHAAEEHVFPVVPSPYRDNNSEYHQLQQQAYEREEMLKSVILNSSTASATSPPRVLYSHILPTTVSAEKSILSATPFNPPKIEDSEKLYSIFDNPVDVISTDRLHPTETSPNRRSITPILYSPVLLPVTPTHGTFHAASSVSSGVITTKSYVGSTTRYSFLTLPPPPAIYRQSKSIFSLPFIDRDSTGHHLLLKALETCRTQNCSFSDANFPPVEISLFQSGSPSGIFDMSLDSSSIRWGLGVDHENRQLPLFSSAPDLPVDSVFRGVARDSYFLTALMHCATRRGVLANLFDTAAASVGCFGVQLHLHGAWKTVVVDSRIPTIGPRPVFSFSGRGGQWEEIWVCLAEKAWAKLHGSYEAICGGGVSDALAYLGGSAPFVIWNSNDSIAHESFDKKQTGTDSSVEKNCWERLVKIIGEFGESNCFVSAVSNQSGIQLGECVVVLAVRAIGPHRLILVREFFEGETTAGSWDWAASSRRWSENPEIGALLRPSGVTEDGHWLSWEEACNRYQRFDVSFFPVSDWPRETLLGAWVEGLSCGGNGPLFEHNPAFRLRNESERLWVSVEQLDRRRSGTPYDSITLFVFEMPVSGEAPDIHKALHRRVSHERVTAFELPLDPKAGPYCLMLSLPSVAAAGAFWITVSSPAKFTFSRIQFGEPSMNARSEMGLLGPENLKD